MENPRRKYKKDTSRREETSEGEASAPNKNVKPLGTIKEVLMSKQLKTFTRQEAKEKRFRRRRNPEEKIQKPSHMTSKTSQKNEKE